MNAIAYSSNSPARHYVSQRILAKKASHLRRRLAKRARNIVDFTQIN